ncbi:MAG: 50S ribosomal protein L4 [Flammeovirgaceae bacterium]
MELAVISTNGQETGRTVDLPETVFGITPNDHVIYLAVKQYLANQRQGTHKSKERAEIVGSTKKIKKQKGTGTARAGSIKSPLFRGGGRVFGPKPRNYGFKLNKKVKSLARKSALSYKASEQNIKVLEGFSFEQARTKDYLAILKNLEVADQKTLLVLNDANDNVYLSSRNLPKAAVATVDTVSTYEILHADQVLIAEDAVEKFSNF